MGLEWKCASFILGHAVTYGGPAEYEYCYMVRDHTHTQRNGSWRLAAGLWVRHRTMLRARLRRQPTPCESAINHLNLRAFPSLAVPCHRRCLCQNCASERVACTLQPLPSAALASHVSMRAPDLDAGLHAARISAAARQKASRAFTNAACMQAQGHHQIKALVEKKLRRNGVLGIFSNGSGGLARIGVAKQAVCHHTVYQVRSGARVVGFMEQRMEEAYGRHHAPQKGEHACMHTLRYGRPRLPAFIQRWRC